MSLMAMIPANGLGRIVARIDEVRLLGLKLLAEVFGQIWGLKKCLLSCLTH